MLIIQHSQYNALQIIPALGSKIKGGYYVRKTHLAIIYRNITYPSIMLFKHGVVKCYISKKVLWIFDEYKFNTMCLQEPRALTIFSGFLFTKILEANPHIFYPEN